MNSTAKTFPCEHEHSSGPPNAACTDDLPTRPLHDFASCLIIFTRSCFEKVTYLPFPVGPIIKVLEELVDSWTHPFVESMEVHSLRTLAVLDDQMYAVGNSVERCILGTSTKLRSVPTVLYRRGAIGTSADLWVQYEAALKENIQKAIDLTKRFSILNMIIPVVLGVSAPLARATSDWLVKHSQIEEKGIQTSCEDFLAQENSYEFEGKGTCLQNPSQVDDASAGKETTVSADEGIQEIKELQKVDEPVNSSEEKADLPDVLEMIDSGWLLGAAALSTKKTPGPTRAISSTKSSSSRGWKGIFNRG